MEIQSNWLQLALAPFLTGALGVFSVLLTQWVQKRNEVLRRKTDTRRETIVRKVDSLKNLVDRIREVETLRLFCIGSRIQRDENVSNLKGQLDNCTGHSDIRENEFIQLITKWLDEDKQIHKDLFLELNRICNTALAAAEASGPLPNDLAIDGEVDLAVLVNKWRWANVMEADRPNRRPETKELLDSISKRVIQSSRAYRERLEQELIGL